MEAKEEAHYLTNLLMHAINRLNKHSSSIFKLKERINKNRVLVEIKVDDKLFFSEDHECESIEMAVGQLKLIVVKLLSGEILQAAQLYNGGTIKSITGKW